LWPDLKYGPQGAGLINKLKRLFYSFLQSRKVSSVLDDNYDVIYMNSAGSIELFDYFTNQAPPVVFRAPEMGPTLAHPFASPESKYTEIVSRRVKKWIACAEAVRDDMIHLVKIDPAIIEVIYGCVSDDILDHASSTDETARQNSRSLINSSLSNPLTNDTLAVAVIGKIEIRKGLDLIVNITRELSVRFDDSRIRIIWIGGNVQSPDCHMIQHDLKVLGLDRYVEFIGEVDDIQHYLPGIDLMAMISHQDPFPIANLEASAFGIPIVGFSNSGGTEELLRIAGVPGIVPYLDIERLVEQIAFFADSESLRKETGRKLAQAVNDHFLEGPQIGKIVACIEEVAGVPPRQRQ